MITEEEKQILALNDGWKSCFYCKNNKDANIKLHEDIIVNNKDTSSAYSFALNIPGANIERLQEVVINYGNSYIIFWFAYYVKNSNKEKLFKTILKIGNEYYINLFIEDIELPKELKELAIFI